MKYTKEQIDNKKAEMDDNLKCWRRVFDRRLRMRNKKDKNSAGYKKSTNGLIYMIESMTKHIDELNNELGINIDKSLIPSRDLLE